MYIPSPRDRVIVEGRSHYYIVVAIDPAREVAYIVDVRDHGYVEQVPFSALSHYSMTGFNPYSPRTPRTSQPIQARNSGNSQFSPTARDLGAAAD